MNHFTFTAYIQPAIRIGGVFLAALVLPFLLVFFLSVSARAYYVPDTGQTMSYSTSPHADANYNFPFNQPSYTLISSSGAYLTNDNITGLVWVSTAYFFGSWEDSISYCGNLVIGGYDDWRMANVKEVISIFDYSRNNPIFLSQFFSVGSGVWWTSTSYPGGASAYYYESSVGLLGQYPKVYSETAKCVRGPIPVAEVSSSSSTIEMGQNLTNTWSFSFGIFLAALFVGSMYIGRTL